MNLYKLAELYLKAVLKLPEWAPDWVKSHPDIQKVPETIEKDLKVKDYEEEINFNEGESKLKLSEQNKPFTEKILTLLKTYSLFLKSIIGGDKKFEQYHNKKYTTDDLNQLNILINIIIFPEQNFTNMIERNKVTESITKGKFKISSGQKFTNVYLYLRKLLNDVFVNFPSLPDLKEIEEFKKYSPSKNKKYTLVFSTKPEDVLRMSSSNNWTSCMDIFGGEDNRGGGTHKNKSIGATLAKNIGIIYLTDKEIYNNLGYKMIYRSLVKLIVNQDTKEECLFIDKCYPEDKQAIKNIFKESLSKRYSKVLINQDIKNIKDYYYKKDDNYEQYKITERPYHDTDFNEQSTSPKISNIIQSITNITDFYDFLDRFINLFRYQENIELITYEELRELVRHIFNRVNDMDEELNSEATFDVLKKCLNDEGALNIFHSELRNAPKRIKYNFSKLYNNFSNFD